MSPLAQGRELKYHGHGAGRAGEGVAPRAGAGIEILKSAGMLTGGQVAPRAGAGIEIDNWTYNVERVLVAPRAGAGIEIERGRRYERTYRVAPRAGAGIEIFEPGPHVIYPYGRPSRRGGN